VAPNREPRVGGLSREARAVRGYERALDRVLRAGFTSDIDWALGLASVRPDRQYVLAEIAWVVLNSGFRYQIVRRLWPKFREATYGFDADKIILDRERCRRRCLQLLNYPGKIDAVLAAADAVQGDGWKQVVLDAQQPEKLKRLPFVGPVTCYHLAKSLGVDCVKPDVHLRRAAEAAGFEAPLQLCQAIRDPEEMLRSRLVLVDIVLWRYGEQRQSRGWPAWSEIFWGR